MIILAREKKTSKNSQNKVSSIKNSTINERFTEDGFCGRSGSACAMALRICLAVAALGPVNCAGLPPAPRSVCEQIPGIPGPEDIAIQGNRLLISSHDRRDWARPGEIFAYEPVSGRLRALPRLQEPADISFRPHGIDISADQTRLYVILHDRKEKGPWNGVAIYRITDEALVFDHMVEDPLLTSPNDLAIRPDGSFFITIDSIERGSLVNMLFRLKRGQILFCESTGPCRVAAEGLAFPNGVLFSEGFLFVTASLEDALYRFRVSTDGTLTDRTSLAPIPGGDNLHRDQDALLTTSHPSGTAFIRHRQDSTSLSPSLVYRILPDGSATVIFSDDGSRISAASVALRQKEFLYIGQVFNPFLLRCRAPQAH